MGGGFCPFRRDVAWLPAHAAPIQPLLDRLEFTTGVRNWGYQFRFGLFAISEPPSTSRIDPVVAVISVTAAITVCATSSA